MNESQCHLHYPVINFARFKSSLIHYPNSNWNSLFIPKFNARSIKNNSIRTQLEFNTKSFHILMTKTISFRSIKTICRSFLKDFIKNASIQHKILDFRHTNCFI